MANEQKPIPIEALNPQQLVMIKKNVEEVYPTPSFPHPIFLGNCDSFPKF